MPPKAAQNPSIKLKEILEEEGNVRMRSQHIIRMAPYGLRGLDELVDEIQAIHEAGRPVILAVSLYECGGA